MRMRAVLVGLSLAALPLLIGCGGAGTTNPLNTVENTAGIGAPGTVQMLVMDAPLAGQDALSDVSQVNVTVTRVDLLFDGKADSEQVQDPDTQVEPGLDAEPIKPEDSNDSYITVFDGERAFDLLALANKTLAELTQAAQVAKVAVPSGFYKRVRIYVKTTGSVVKEDGTSVDLRIPSGHLDMPIRLYVSPNETETVISDFMLKGNLHAPTQGHAWYILTPGLRLAKMSHQSEVAGHLHLGQPTLQRVLVTVDLYDAANVNPVLDSAGNPIETTLKLGGQQHDGDGRFSLLGIPAGTYTLRITTVINGVTNTTTRPLTIPDKASVELPDTIPALDAP